MSESTAKAEQVAEPRRGVRQVLLSYFYWTYSRGTFHYDVMVTLILAFIFITPHLWNYGDRPQSTERLRHPMEVIGVGAEDDPHMIVTVDAADVQVPDGTPDNRVKKILSKAIEPVTGDAVFVDTWQTVLVDGRLVWKVKAHR